MIDGSGFYGFCLHYSFLFALFGSHVLVFLVLWRKKRLGINNEAKDQVFEDE